MIWFGLLFGRRSPFCILFACLLIFVCCAVASLVAAAQTFAQTYTSISRSQHTYVYIFIRTRFRVRSVWHRYRYGACQSLCGKRKTKYEYEYENLFLRPFASVSVAVRACIRNYSNKKIAVLVVVVVATQMFNNDGHIGPVKSLHTG